VAGGRPLRAGKPRRCALKETIASALIRVLLLLELIRFEPVRFDLDGGGFDGHETHRLAFSTDQPPNPGLGILELALEVSGKMDSSLETGQGVFQGKRSLLQVLYDALELGERGLEGKRGDLGRDGLCRRAGRFCFRGPAPSLPR
jgi:hypothetical protein